jgi:hypothetical protein
VGGAVFLADMDRPFFHTNDILKEKRIAGSERVRRYLIHTKGSSQEG